MLVMNCPLSYLSTQKIEHKLSKEDTEIHFCEGAGFIQVLIANPITPELYGIKFINNVEGTEFYIRTITDLGEVYLRSEV